MENCSFASRWFWGVFCDWGWSRCRSFDLLWHLYWWNTVHTHDFSRIASKFHINHSVVFITCFLDAFCISCKLCDVSVTRFLLQCGPVYDQGGHRDPHAVGHMVSEKDFGSWLHIYWQFLRAFGMCSLLSFFTAPCHIITCTNWSTKLFF